MARGIDTKCIHLEEDEGQCSHYGALSYPIYQTATYAHPGVGQSTGFDYSRLQNQRASGEDGGCTGKRN